MCSNEWERSFRMVECGQIGPRSHRVAGLASLRAAVWLQLRHLRGKFTAVRVCVAARARAIIEMVGDNFRRRHSVWLGSVALAARYSEVRARQRKTAFLVHRNRERRRMKAFDRVAFFALVVVRGCGKLAVVFVVMAVGALRKRHLVLRSVACRHVAFVARNARVFAVERICGRGVIFHGE